MDRKIVYIYRSVYGSTNVINYDAGNSTLNTFLWHFDIWGSNGHFTLCSDGNHSAVSFECSKEFLELAKTHDFQRAFRRMGVKVTFDANDILEID